MAIFPVSIVMFGRVEAYARREKTICRPVLSSLWRILRL